MQQLMESMDQSQGAAGRQEVGAASEADAPMAGKTVLLVHPAWHSCGSHQVFASQARAYRSLGARLISLAVADSPGAVEGSGAHKTYVAATPDLEADARLYTGMPLLSVLNPSFLGAVRLWLHGNFAAILLESARLAPIPAALLAERRVDLIHCNHFFCMPVALRLRERHGCPIALDTHDLQARQYALRNEQGWTVPPVAKFEDMLGIELAAMRGADVLAHLNDEEAAAFKTLLPEKRHELVYPAVPPIAPGAGGDDLIIVASANYANYRGLAWFLREVLPLVPDEVRRRIKIIGNLDRTVRARAPALYKANAQLFLGHVRDLGARLRQRRRRAAADDRRPWRLDQDDRGDVLRRASDRDAARLPRHEARPRAPRQRHARGGRAGFRGGAAAGGRVAARSGEPAGCRDAEILSKPFRFRGLSRRAGATRFAAFETCEHLI